MIKKIDIYILKQFFIKLFFLIIGFIILFCLVSIIEHLDKFIDASMPNKDIFMYHVYSIPWFINIALPMSTLISTVFVINTMQKNNELTALKASGIGLIRLSIPLFLTGIIISIFSFKFENTIVTQYLREKINLEQEYKLKKSSKKQVRKNDIHKIINPNSGNLSNGKYELISDVLCEGECDTLANVMLSIKKFKYLEEVGTTVSIEHLQRIETKNGEEKYKITKRLDSPKFIWKKDKEVWRVKKPTITFFSPNDSITNYIKNDKYIEIDIKNLTPYPLVQETLKPDEMTYNELNKLVNTMHENGIYNKRWVVDLYFKSAFACINFLMILFGICLSIRKPKANMAVGLTMSIGVIFIYYTVLIFGKSLGYTGTLSPFLSVWMVNILFFIFGIYLFANTKT